MKKTCLAWALGTCLALPLVAFGDSPNAPHFINFYIHNLTNKPITLKAYASSDTYYTLTNLSNKHDSWHTSDQNYVLQPGDTVETSYEDNTWGNSSISPKAVVPFFSVYGYTLALVSDFAYGTWNAFNYSEWKLKWEDKHNRAHGYSLMYKSYNQGFQLYDADPNSGQSPQPGCSTETIKKTTYFYYSINCYITNDSIANNMPE